MHMHRSIRVVYDRSRLKKVKLRVNVRTQQLQTLVGVFGQQCCSRLHRAKSLTMIKIEIHSTDATTPNIGGSFWPTML